MVSSGTPDANVANNGDTADVTVVREVDLSIAKTHDADAVRIGDELSFTLQVANAGPSEATDVVVTDVVPAGLEVLTVAGDDVGADWTIETVGAVDQDDPTAGTRVVARYGQPLAPAERAAPLIIETRVLVGSYPEVVNTAAVTAAEISDQHPDRTPDDNRAEDAVAVPPMAALTVTKTAVGTFQAGKTGLYRIVVRNDGPTADPGAVVVTDALPEGMSFAGSPDATARADGRVVTWALADGLAVNEEVTLTLRVNLAEATYPAVTNVVSVASATEQTADARLVSAADADVAAADPLATTGAAPAWGLAFLAALMMIAGALFLAHRRRRAAGE